MYFLNSLITGGSI